MDDRGRDARLEALFSAHAAAVRAYALRRTGGVDAEDVVMEVFVIAYRRLDEVPDDALPWLFGCARRVLANQRRGVMRAEALVARIGGSIPVPTLGIGAPDELVEAVGTLEERDREVLFLSAWEGLEPAAIAKVLGCSGAAARVRLHRARRRPAAAMAHNSQPFVADTAEVP